LVHWLQCRPGWRCSNITFSGVCISLSATQTPTPAPAPVPSQSSAPLPSSSTAPGPSLPPTPTAAPSSSSAATPSGVPGSGVPGTSSTAIPASSTPLASAQPSSPSSLWTAQELRKKNVAVGQQGDDLINCKSSMCIGVWASIGVSAFLFVVLLTVKVTSRPAHPANLLAHHKKDGYQATTDQSCLRESE
jgi:hypothetical protein